jgi:hypothetical protein
MWLGRIGEDLEIRALRICWQRNKVAELVSLFLILSNRPAGDWNVLVAASEIFPERAVFGWHRSFAMKRLAVYHRSVAELMQL